MKLPKKLKIGGHLYTVDTSKELPGLDGELVKKENTIRICKTLPKNQQDATLIHEILHALNAVFNDKEISHMVLDSIAEQLYQVLKDNKLKF